MVEGSETPGGGLGPDQPGGMSPREGRGHRGEGDLLAERRARRAVESGEQVLARRAEAAEATVRTLEAHVASLQRRLGEAEHQREHPSEPISHAAGASGHAGPPELAEQELRRMRQREYAEQRQRLEAEERTADIERENGAEVERLRRRLSDSEGEAGMLAERLQQLRRELAEAEQTLAAERASLREAEAELRGTLAQLEERAALAERELESERSERERAERELERIRAGHRKLEGLVEELKDTSGRLREVALAATGGEGEMQAASAAAGAGEASVAGAQAAAAIPRARARATPHNGEMVEALAAAVERLRTGMAEDTSPASSMSEMAPRHKHSMSLIGRLRMARKQRRQR
jgi:DNA repair exonuclease SbcCD ATPase subunit